MAKCSGQSFSRHVFYALMMSMCEAWKFGNQIVVTDICAKCCTRHWLKANDSNSSKEKPGLFAPHLLTKGGPFFPLSAAQKPAPWLITPTIVVCMVFRALGAVCLPCSGTFHMTDSILRVSAAHGLPPVLSISHSLCHPLWNTCTECLWQR